MQNPPPQFLLAKHGATIVIQRHGKTSGHAKQQRRRLSAVVPVNDAFRNDRVP